MLNLILLAIISTTYAIHGPLILENIGSNCGENDVFQVETFEVMPWPPILGAKSYIYMHGMFHQNIWLQEISVGTCVNSDTCTWQRFDINTRFYAEESWPFEILWIYPSEPGNYFTNVHLTAGNHVSCWQFTYELN
ncbi:hypothetical protein SteCoe_38844 [Stentor coeruleus]|uniref:MD-2-related lipid-recognition domain-containing protein n=1 Tax=Stentor coeruleus TaxID=5963 RepID=A0A1R2AL30_9CILI|nr:hypothetical protein SteCoe_38844 [Stentor coeruleus]